MGVLTNAQLVTTPIAHGQQMEAMRVQALTTSVAATRKLAGADGELVAYVRTVGSRAKADDSWYHSAQERYTNHDVANEGSYPEPCCRSAWNVVADMLLPPPALVRGLAVTDSRVPRSGGVTIGRGHPQISFPIRNARHGNRNGTCAQCPDRDVVVGREPDLHGRPEPIPPARDRTIRCRVLPVPSAVAGRHAFRARFGRRLAAATARSALGYKHAGPERVPRRSSAAL